ncbi:MAG: hypothetical protein UX24_C0009G0012 [Candidatus Giovannonibacteria bacterium GW2011_GWB1_45_9b]|uniref:Uncharacterized protein n=4 Tax=Parcubacteria group TaxID=1794811 RepID=A0A0G1PHR8_9BACT|nr:MAG: hypothetical protein UU83_C0004G0006 [Candidatus Jorgensenbacteria bacterium GW2011_GWF2_41_8]KKS27495.1 MAG: hypothetical protein UU84_C0004G0009 [Candidatus Yanofskybacteria bacterium GW2011_GWC2_41_9]KKU04948.1 MAG: hypothetical protein UX06_C0005G0008 [Candidatus Giovannonibacteria bacterium GW2011_GWA2_45_21]KKU16480.1 MAG: hypothetical protein UX24_C0009G0012 [Candidatus Giovannonibacteria bacterium GW2011_GWB1_45_9b]
MLKFLKEFPAGKAIFLAGVVSFLIAGFIGNDNAIATSLGVISFGIFYLAFCRS